jgi:DNA uptake protein ComE-like DNA-binding protein
MILLLGYIAFAALLFVGYVVLGNTFTALIPILPLAAAIYMYFQARVKAGSKGKAWIWVLITFPFFFITIPLWIYLHRSQPLQQAEERKEELAAKADPLQPADVYHTKLTNDMEAGADKVIKPPPIVQTPLQITDSELLDLNIATEEELAGLPGISIILAKKAVSVRQKTGGFKSFDDFCRHLSLKPHIANLIRPLCQVSICEPGVAKTTSGRVIDY